MEHCDNKTNQNTNGQSPDSISQCSCPGLAVLFKGDKMKVKFNTLQQMRRDIKVVAEHYGYMECLRLFNADSVCTAHWLWNKVFMNRSYSSDNPNVVLLQSGRLLKYEPDFEMYPDGTNDDTLKTALVKVCRQIFA